MPTETPARRPNVVWIFGDQHRAQSLGIAGDPNVRTPNIDNLAHEGLRFPNAVSGSPLCCPYRGALLTGRYPHNSVPGHECPLPEGMPTIAKPFNDAGYKTAYFGKWHVDGHHERDGRAALHTVKKHRRGGFGTWLGYDNNNAQYDAYLHGHDEEGNEVPHHHLDGYETDKLTDLTLEFMKRRDADGEPFFCVLSAQPPHDPYVAPEEWMRRHSPATVKLRPNVPDVAWVVEQARRELAGYHAMIENLDWNVGRVMKLIRESSLRENTHIIFFSDHGDMHGSHGMFRKTNPYEESMRVPFIIGGTPSKYYGKIGICDAAVNHVDIGATSLGLCGIDVPDWIEGTSYAPRRLHGKRPGDEPDSAFLQMVMPTKHGDSTDRPWRGVATRDGWKYVCLEHQPWLMFDLNADPYEQVNLAHNTRYAAKRKQLHDRLAQWIADTGDTFPLPVL